MPPRLSRPWLFAGIGAAWLAGVIGIFAVTALRQPETIVVVHWANAHPMRQGLLPQMADTFNKGDYTTPSGKRIEVRVFRYDSAPQVEDLSSRVLRGVALDPKLPDPVIVTPQADHWLAHANHTAGRALVDLGKTQSIARTWIGIVTYRDMAECLGWPHKELGFADIIALRNDPRGWAAYPCAKTEWGQRPLVAYTDPTFSTTGRGVLFTLYSVGAGKPAEQLTVADVSDPAVIAYVKQFQGLVDHYVSGTIPLNTKVHLGPRYGHFFIMPEDNLIHLYEGTERALIGGVEVNAPPIPRPMVMIYPKEGSIVHNNSAAVVQAPWVSPEQVEAAERWVAFLRGDAQQRAFMAAGFRPATSLVLADPISGKYGLDPTKPTVAVNPDRIDGAVAAAIVGSWDEVKKPGVATFVVDVSGSMSGVKLDQARQGLSRALDGMAAHTRVGLLTFADTIGPRVEVAPLTENRFAIAGAVQSMRAGGGTALYDAILEGVRMTDAAPGDPDAIRAVVVLTDGRSNGGKTQIHDLVRMMSRDEKAIPRCPGFEGDVACRDVAGAQVTKENIIGTELAINTRHRIQIFFVGIGRDADLDVGRILAEATGAEYRGTAEQDLANVLEQFGKYF